MLPGPLRPEEHGGSFTSRTTGRTLNGQGGVVLTAIERFVRRRARSPPLFLQISISSRFARLLCVQEGTEQGARSSQSPRTLSRGQSTHRSWQLATRLNKARRQNQRFGPFPCGVAGPVETTNAFPRRREERRWSERGGQGSLASMQFLSELIRLAHVLSNGYETPRGDRCFEYRPPGVGI